MPAHEDAYNSALRLSRQRFFREEGVPARYVDALYREFAAMLVRIDADQLTGEISAARAGALKRSIMTAINKYGKSLHGLLVDGTIAAARSGAQGHARGLAAASRAAGVPISHSFASVPLRALEGMMRRRGLPDGGGLSATYRTLINRKIQTISGELDALLTSAVARGQDSASMTTEIARLMAREDPKMLETLKSLGPRGGRTAKAIREGTVVTDLAGAKRLLYDSRRISIGEINSSHHESTLMGMSESPVVDVVQWFVSGRHNSIPGLAPDVCDAMAEADLFGFGPGRYHKRAVPSLPHSHCGCGVQAVLLRPADWGRARRSLPSLRLASDRDMRRLMGAGKTQNYVDRQRETLNNRVEAAWEAAKSGERVAA